MNGNGVIGVYRCSSVDQSWAGGMDNPIWPFPEGDVYE